MNIETVQFYVMINKRCFLNKTYTKNKKGFKNLNFIFSLVNGIIFRNPGS